jgi:TRAP transporter 4TM/12TM fusion protein
MAMNMSNLSRITDRIITILSVILVLYVCTFVFYLPESPTEFQNTFLGFSFALFYVSRLQKSNQRFNWVLLGLLLLAVVSAVYIKVFYNQLEFRRGFPTLPDVIIGTILFMVVIETTRQSYGSVIPIIISSLFLYTLFGHYIPEPLGHGHLEFSRIISSMNIGLTGIYGDILYAACNYVFFFIVFGALLELSGAISFFYEVGKILPRKFLKSAPAQTAVVSSALVGMISGSPTANAAIVGPFTIPLMKKAGFTQDQAGGVEAAASTGGAIMPPVMGAVAFVMAEVLGVSYATVMLAGFIPAFLYFLSVGMCVEMTGRKLGLKPWLEPMDKRLLLIRCPLFIIPLGLIMFFLLHGYSPLYSAFWATISLLGLSLIKKETRISLQRLLSALKRSAISGAELGILSACLGPLTTTITLTGLATKIGNIIMVLSGGNTVVVLILAAIVSLFLGTALPIVACYIIVAVLVAPVLVSWGVGAFEAHFFALYFGVLSAVTPPTAPPAIVTSKLAGGDFNRTTLWATKFCIPSFIIPFLIIRNPALIGRFSNPITDIISILSCIIGVFSCSVMTVGYYITTVKPFERILYGLVTVILFTFAFNLNMTWFFMGIGSFLALSLWQWRQSQNAKRET